MDRVQKIYWTIASASVSLYGFNSLTPKCVPAGTKNSCSEDFLLAKHTSHKHPHLDETFSHLAAEPKK